MHFIIDNGPFVVIGLLSLFWLAMFIHAIRTKSSDRVLYILTLIIGGPFVGAPVYYFIVYRKRKGILNA